MLGRFIQPDTVVPDAKDLQAYNRYSYVRNNPLKYVDPSGHSFGSWFKKLFGAFIGALLAVVSGFALAPLVGAYWAGVIAGTVGGLISGAITGGLKGALLGGLFGALSGAVFGGLNIGLEKLGIADQWARAGILAGVGAGLSAATGGWQGLVIFGAGLAGAAAGYGIGKPIGARVQAWKAMRDNGLTYRPGRAHFDYSQGGDGGSAQLAGNGAGGNDLLGLAPDVATDAFFNAGSGNYGSQAVTSGAAAAGKGYLDVNISGGYWLGLTGGVLISDSGIYPYFGGGLVSPGVSGSITWSPSAVSTGWNVGAQFQAGIAGQIGYAFGQGGGRFWELGAGYPTGFAATGYYIFGH